MERTHSCDGCAADEPCAGCGGNTPTSDPAYLALEWGMLGARGRVGADPFLQAALVRDAVHAPHLEPSASLTALREFTRSGVLATYRVPGYRLPMPPLRGGGPAAPPADDGDAGDADSPSDTQKARWRASSRAVTTSDDDRRRYALPEPSGHPLAKARCCIKAFRYPESWRVCSGEATTTLGAPQDRAGVVFQARVEFIEDPTKACFCECCLFTQLVLDEDAESKTWVVDCGWVEYFVTKGKNGKAIATPGDVGGTGSAEGRRRLAEAKALAAKRPAIVTPTGEVIVEGSIVVEDCYGDAARSGYAEFLAGKTFGKGRAKARLDPCDKSYVDKPSLRTLPGVPWKHTFSFVGEVFDRCRRRVKRSERVDLVVKWDGTTATAEMTSMAPEGSEPAELPKQGPGAGPCSRTE